MDFDYDVIVIGGGVLGCFAARSLSRYALKTALLEKREDICTGISRANTAIVYSGCDTKPGTLKTSMCVRAAKGFAELCAELGVRYSQCGSLMICFGERGAGVLKKKFRDGTENGVRGVRLLTREEVLELEPNISERVHSGLFVPDTGTVMPWELCLAAAENAAANGAEIILNADVTEVARLDGGGFAVRAGETIYSAKAIVNCAGLASDKLHDFVSEPAVRIVPTAGDYFILDTKTSGHIRHVIFHEPEEKGKGLTLVPTVDGNILLGPTERAVSVCEKYGPETMESGYETEHEGLDLLRELAADVIPTLSLDHIIRSFGTVRPNPYFISSDKSISDFCIIESKDGAFISLIGVKTPGLTCANELGIHTADKVAARLGAAVNPKFDPRRAPPVRLSELAFEERERIVSENPDYGRIACRCRGISEGEIKDAIRRFPGAATPDGVKRRTGAGSGRCQGGFCGQSVMELLRGSAEPPRFDPASRPGNSGQQSDGAKLAGANNARSSFQTYRYANPDSGALNDYDIIVIGGGPAGMAAALGAATEQSKTHKVLLIERAEALGGILNQCTHTGFGLSYFGEELTGQEYARRFIERVGASDVEVLTDTMVLNISREGEITISSRKTGLARVSAKAVVLSSGCRERPSGALQIAGTRPAGVFTAGAAQKMINLGGYDIGNRFVILGSGDVGLIVARELVTRGKEVIAVIEKEDHCGGLPRNRISCLEQYGIPLITQATVSRIHGVGRIAAVTVSGVRSQGPGFGGWEPGNEAYDAGSIVIPCDTLITSVGLIPERELLDSFEGSLPDWLFLCGNACYVHDTVDDVSEEAGRTGRLAAEYVEGESRAVRNTFRAYETSAETNTPDERTARDARRKDPNSEAATSREEQICIGCPKCCNVVKTTDGWRGLNCGRDEPQLNNRQ